MLAHLLTQAGIDTNIPTRAMPLTDTTIALPPQNAPV
jgi:hypothetical protein